MGNDFVTKTNLTCPKCGFTELLDIPQDRWLISHACASCGTELRPLAGDCCVFCSYGEHHCISKQREALAEGTKWNEDGL